MAPSPGLMLLCRLCTDCTFGSAPILRSPGRCLLPTPVLLSAQHFGVCAAETGTIPSLQRPWPRQPPGHSTWLAGEKPVSLVLSWGGYLPHLPTLWFNQ